MQTNLHLWQFRSLKPIRINKSDCVAVDSFCSELTWNRVDYFVGVDLKCQECHEVFSFSAAEQKDWHHNWGFSVHAYPKFCVICRRLKRDYRSLEMRLNDLTKGNDFSLENCNEVVIIISTLLRMGKIFGLRHGERLIRYLNKSKFKGDNKIRNILLKRNAAQQGDAPEPPSAAG